MDSVIESTFMDEDLLRSPSSNTSHALIPDADLSRAYSAEEYRHRLETQGLFEVAGVERELAPIYCRVETAFSPKISFGEHLPTAASGQAIQLLVADCDSAHDQPRIWAALDVDQTWPRHRWTPEGSAYWGEKQDAVRAYGSRIQELCEDAFLDGVALSRDSERDFWSFMRSMPWARPAGVVLLDSGNLRAVWREDVTILVGLQFLGRGWIEYVFLRRRVGSSRISQASGVDTVDGVKRQLLAFDMTSWMNA